ncbi:MAG TPA: SDR family oxidoreductase [Verrucomicrobiales bacterium]|jgi:3-oxoacyl-[acyl-carrier protein] reductase|nr:SDR family oxidoreductase [Verrucomicrobiales bacterium]
MNLDLHHKLALVTASTGGIGFEIARTLAREGADVVVNGRTTATVAGAAAKLRAEFPAARIESLVADNGTAEGFMASTQAFPDVDILVNNLGIYEVASFFDETDEAWERHFEANVMSGVRLSRHYLARMLKKGTGRVVFIASEAAVSPPAEMAAYSATKTMQLSLSRSLAELTKGTQVTVNTVMPGSTKTEGVGKMVEEMFPGLSAEAADREFMRQHRPTSLLGRLITPEEIADVVAFVCSGRASAINGAALRADGGLVRHIL